MKNDPSVNKKPFLKVGNDASLFNGLLGYIAQQPVTVDVGQSPRETQLRRLAEIGSKLLNNKVVTLTQEDFDAIYGSRTGNSLVDIFDAAKKKSFRKDANPSDEFNFIADNELPSEILGNTKGKSYSTGNLFNNYKKSSDTIKVNPAVIMPNRGYNLDDLGRIMSHESLHHLMGTRQPDFPDSILTGETQQIKGMPYGDALVQALYGRVLQFVSPHGDEMSTRITQALREAGDNPTPEQVWDKFANAKENKNITTTMFNDKFKSWFLDYIKGRKY